MDQSASPQPTFELPQQGPSSTEAPGALPALEMPSVPTQERLPTPGNTPSGAPMQPLMQPAPQPSLPPTQGAQLPPAAGRPTMAPPSAMRAADADLIEKEWVMKAKAIVNATSHDPYAQNKEINKVKADYLKKRYNKTIPVSDK